MTNGTRAAEDCLFASLDVDEVLHAVRAGVRDIDASGVVELWTADDGPPGVDQVRDAIRTRRAVRTSSMHALPILYQDILLGVLTCTGDDGEALASFLHQAALAIRNAKLFEDSRRRERETTASYELARRLSTRLSVEQILDAVVDGVMDALGCDGAASYRWDDATGGLVYVRGRNHDETMVRQLVLRPGEGVAGRAYAERRAVWTRDRTNDASVQYPDDVRPLFVRAARFRGYLAVPILFRNQVVGVLGAHHHDPHDVSGHEIDVMSNLATLAATAIENARLYQESETRRHAAEALAELTRGLTHSLEPDVVNHRVLASINTLLGTGFASLVRIDPLSGDQIVVAVSSEGPASVAPGLVYPRHTGVVGRAVADRRPYVTPNASRDPRIAIAPEHRELVARSPRQAILAVPLMLKDEVIGGLLVADREGRVFAEDEVRLAQRFADQAALALHNAHILEELTLRQERLEALVEANQQLSRIQSVEALLDTLAEQCGRLLDADSVGFRVIEGDQMVLHGAWGDVKRVTVRSTIGLTEALSGTVASTGEPLNVRDSMEHLLPVHRETLERIRCRAWLGVPVKLGDRVVGVLSNRTHRPEGFSEGDLRIAAAVASQAAIALENARLYADITKTNAHLEQQAATLRARNAELDSFAFAVSHDLKAPLVSLHGLAGLLADEYGPALGVEGGHYLGRITATVERMERLVGDVLKLSRSGREDYAPETVAIDEVVTTVLQDLAERVQTRAVTVTREDLGSVRAVRTDMEQIFSNLIGNAVRYLGDAAAPAIAIGRADRGDWAEFFVRDNGIGIDPMYHTKIFETFQRLQEIEAEGSGVGLAIVKKLVEAAGGRVWVESAIGQGATFFFTWPQTPPTA
jgi:GAF domain-containing protein